MSLTATVGRSLLNTRLQAPRDPGRRLEKEAVPPLDGRPLKSNQTVENVRHNASRQSHVIADGSTAQIIRWFTTLVVVWYVVSFAKAWYARSFAGG